MSRSKDECKPVLNWEKKILLDSFYRTELSEEAQHERDGNCKCNL